MKQAGRWTKWILGALLSVAVWAGRAQSAKKPLKHYRLSSDLFLAHHYRGSFSNSFFTAQRALNPGLSLGLETWLFDSRPFFITLGIYYRHYDMRMERSVSGQGIYYGLHQWADQLYTPLILHVLVVPRWKLYLTGGLTAQWWKAEHYHYWILNNGHLVYDDRNRPVNHVLILSRFNGFLGLEKMVDDRWSAYFTVDQSATINWAFGVKYLLF